MPSNLTSIIENPSDTFFEKHISKEEFALYMRQFLHATVMLNFSSDDHKTNEEIANGYYWLTEFIEELNPQLTKEL